MDLRHKGNILVSEKGEPFLIDFNSSFAFKEKGFLRRSSFSPPPVGGLWGIAEIEGESFSLLDDSRRNSPFSNGLIGFEDSGSLTETLE